MKRREIESLRLKLRCIFASRRSSLESVLLFLGEVLLSSNSLQLEGSLNWESEVLQEVKHVGVNLRVNIGSPHVVQVVIVLNLHHLGSWGECSLKDLEIVRSDESIILAGEEKDVNVREGVLELLDVVVRRGGLVIDLLVLGGAIVKLGEVARADVLNPMHQVLGRSASDIVTAHHGEGAEVKVVGNIKTYNSFNEIPNSARKVVEEGSRVV